MKWLTALALGAILGFVMPMALGGQHGVWMNYLREMGNDPSARGIAGAVVLGPAVPALGDRVPAVLQLAQPLSVAHVRARSRDPRHRNADATLNPYGDVFGGWLMSQMALGAGAMASRGGSRARR